MAKRENWRRIVGCSPRRQPHPIDALRPMTYGALGLEKAWPPPNRAVSTRFSLSLRTTIPPAAARLVARIEQTAARIADNTRKHEDPRECAGAFTRRRRGATSRCERTWRNR